MLTFSINADINQHITKGDLAESRPTTDEGREWYSEVVFKTLVGKIGTTVNVDAYGYTCERNTRMNTNKKQTSLLTVEEINNGQRGVADSVASYFDDNISSIIESSALRTAMEQFHEMADYILPEEGVNLQRVLELALSGNVESQEKLRLLIERYSLSEIISEILSHEGAVDHL